MRELCLAIRLEAWFTLYQILIDETADRGFWFHVGRFL